LKVKEMLRDPRVKIHSKMKSLFKLFKIYVNGTKGRFTLWPKVERLPIPTNQIVETKNVASWLFTLEAKVPRLSPSKMLT
jgi:hypothetical protein